MAVQGPVNLSSELNLPWGHCIRLFKSSRVQIQAHIETQSVRHPMVQPASGVSPHRLLPLACTYRWQTRSMVSYNIHHPNQA